MTASDNSVECRCQFEPHIDHYHDPDLRALERDVLGCDYGGTSWTTAQQAAKIPALLGLDSGDHLLEIGAGTGWPGIYLARLSDCEVTLLDLPYSALKLAQQRALKETVAHRCHFLVASGTALPLANTSFQAIEHSDILCCLADKRGMLEECRRVAADGAKMLFYVIAPAPGLTGSELHEACEAGPPFVGMTDTYAQLLTHSGWDILQNTDLTGEYLQSLRRLLSGLNKNSARLKTVLGTLQYNDELQQRQRQVEAIENRLLVREMFLARAI